MTCTREHGGSSSLSLWLLSTEKEKRDKNKKPETLIKAGSVGSASDFHYIQNV